MVRSVGPQRYAAGIVPSDPQALAQFLRTELVALQNAIDAVTDGQLDVTHVVPERPRSGMMRYADGTNWNPGSGEGFYGYYGGAWVKL